MPTEPLAARPIPWRTIWATIGAVVITLAAITVLRELSRILVWLVIAGFFAIVLTPAVDFLEHRLRVRRVAATILVFLAAFGLLVGLLYTFISPIVSQAQEAVDNFPRYVEEAKAGRGPLGGVVTRFELDRRIEERQDDIQKALNNLGSQSVGILQGIGNAVAATLTIVVLIILMLLSGPRMLQSGLNALPPPRREHVRRVAADSAKAVTGYVAGNLLISIIAGTATFIFLFFAGVPFRGVLALWVGFADLIPLVGATLGAIPTILVAFLHSTTVGIATVIFYVVYQQFENHVLQVTIMARTVDLNPLVVLISVLAGVEMFGLLGALLAIPVAGIIQVVVRDIWDERRGELKDEPTIGIDEVPVSEVEGAEPPEPDATEPDAADEPAPPDQEEPAEEAADLDAPRAPEELKQ